MDAHCLKYKAMNPLTDMITGPETAKPAFLARPEGLSSREYPHLTDEQAASVAARYPIRMKAESNIFPVAASEYPGVVEEVNALLQGGASAAATAASEALPPSQPPFVPQFAPAAMAARPPEVPAAAPAPAPEFAGVFAGGPFVQPNAFDRQAPQFSPVQTGVSPAVPTSEQAAMAAQARGLIDEIHGSGADAGPSFSLAEMERAA